MHGVHNLVPGWDGMAWNGDERRSTWSIALLWVHRDGRIRLEPDVLNYDLVTGRRRRRTRIVGGDIIVGDGQRLPTFTEDEQLEAQQLEAAEREEAQAWHPVQSTVPVLVLVHRCTQVAFGQGHTPDTALKNLRDAAGKRIRLEDLVAVSGGELPTKDQLQWAQNLADGMDANVRE